MASKRVIYSLISVVLAQGIILGGGLQAQERTILTVALRDSYGIPFTDPAGRPVIPYRAARSLLNALKNDGNPPYFARQTDGSYALEVWEVRSHLVEALRNKTVIVLDSTVPPALRQLLPDLEEITYRVAQNIGVTQITNALYTKRDLLNSRTCEIVSDALNGFVAEHQPHNHLTIAPQRFIEDCKLIIADLKQLNPDGNITQSVIVNRQSSIVNSGHGTGNL